MKGKYCIFYEGSLGGQVWEKAARENDGTRYRLLGLERREDEERRVVAWEEDQSWNALVVYKKRRFFRLLYYARARPFQQRPSRWSAVAIRALMKM